MVLLRQVAAHISVHSTVCTVYGVGKSDVSFVAVDHLVLMIIIVNPVDGGVFFFEFMYVFAVYSAAIGIEM